jgi:hypothetical protein
MDRGGSGEKKQSADSRLPVKDHSEERSEQQESEARRACSRLAHVLSEPLHPQVRVVVVVT